MKNARILRRELNLWKLAWQQIETFLQRIDDARGQDESHRRKLDALLRAARAVEHERAGRVADKPLSDPIIDAMPTQWYSEESGAHHISDPWSLDLRKWRVPGMDETELAVGILKTDQDGSIFQQVPLVADQKIFAVRIDKSDRRFPQSDDGLLTVRLPSYPRAEPGDSIPRAEPDESIVGAGVLVDIEEDEGTSSLFSLEDRRKATAELSLEEDPIRSWSDLCGTRRRQLPISTDEYNQIVKYVGPTAGPFWRMHYMSQARSAVDDVRAGRAAIDSDVAAVLQKIETAARTAASAAESDAQDLSIAAEVVEEEGVEQEDFPELLRAAANSLGGRPSAFRQVADAAAALLAALNSTETADRLEQALDALEATLSRQELFTREVEDGPLRPVIDAAVEARISYPDGTLRIVRALEWGFLTTWPARLRWFKLRNQVVLEPILDRFRKPFTDGLAALIRGGYTGLECEGLETAEPASVGSEVLATGHPASLIPALDDTIETGHVGILGGDRPTPIVILGLGKTNDKLALNISPLLVSVAPQTEDVPGSPGLVTGNQSILCRASGLQQRELRWGESNAGRASDGLVHQTVALWSELCLVFGWLAVERALQGNASLSDSQFANRLIPDPSAEPLRDLVLHGEVPACATTLVIQGAFDEYWDRSVYPPRPRIARPHEMLLLRGRGATDDERAQGPMLQSAVEVEKVYRTNGSMLERMDTSNAALLSISPVAPSEERKAKLVCGPEEDVIVVLLRQSWQRKKLVADITLRRDFLGFEPACLATETRLPEDFLEKIASVIDDGGVDRQQEFEAAAKLIADWTRYAHE